jgi:hypothetical protein
MTGQGPMRASVFDGARVSSEFPGGAGSDFRLVDDGHVALTIPSDPDCRGLPGYDYFFCIQISNGSARRRLVLEARMPQSGENITWSPSRIPVFASADRRSWYVLDSVQASPDHRELRFTLDLAPDETVYCANSLPCPSEWMASWIEALVSDSGGCARIVTIGTSVLGRPIPLVVVTDGSVAEDDKDRVLITSGFHPAEADWLATTALLEDLTSDAAWAVRLRQQYVFDVVPQVNPDGFDLGTNASNAHGVNMYWDFRRGDRTTSPEAVALWEWIAAHPPDLYVDYHAYVYQLQKDYRPYLRNAAEYPAAVRPAVRALNRAFAALCGGRGVRGAATSDPLSLAPQLTSHFGTITYPKFHMHLYHGVKACRRLGSDVIRTLLAAAEPYRPLRLKTGRRAWRPGAADRALARLQHASTIVKARNVLRRVGQRAVGRTVRESVALMPGPGVPPHWSGHLWRNRPQATPALVIGERRQTDAARAS